MALPCLKPGPAAWSHANRPRPGAPSLLQPRKLTTQTRVMVDDTIFNGNGIAREILSRPGIEGDPLGFLKATEAYWKAMKQQKHEPHKPGPTVITVHPTLLSAVGASSSLSPSSLSSPDQSSPSTAPHHISTGATDIAADAISGSSSSSSSSSNNGTSNSASSSNSSSGRHGKALAAAAVESYDVLMCGGTLGLLVATLLQRQGYSVCIVEKRKAEGRTQEWNTSREELKVLKEVGLLTPEEFEEVVVTEYDPVRVGLEGGKDIWVEGCLNIGVHPKRLLEFVRGKFLAAGGVIYEHTAFKSGEVHPDGILVKLMCAREAPGDVGDTNRPTAMGDTPVTGVTSDTSASGDTSAATHVQSAVGKVARVGVSGRSSSSRAGGAAAAARAPSQLRGRLLLDCMGHYSPIVKQLRRRAKPEGMVLVVGSCAEGFPADRNQTADLLVTTSPAADDMQLFWEAFPAEGGRSRTTYMFAYSDADPSRPTFEQLLDAYFQLLPDYQKVSLGQLGFKRVLFGGFPSYSNGPLKPGFDRVLQLGDASACQSPLSFGGFGSMLRHLNRLSEAISHALREDKLKQGDLALIHPYQPSLAAAWLYQRAMGFKVGQVAPPKPSLSTPMTSPLDPVLTSPATLVPTPKVSGHKATGGSSGDRGGITRKGGRSAARQKVTVRIPELVSSALKGSEQAVSSLALNVAQSSRAAAVAAAELGVQTLSVAMAAAAVVAARVAGGSSGAGQPVLVSATAGAAGGYGNGGVRRGSSVGRVGAVHHHHHHHHHQAAPLTAMHLASSSSKGTGGSSSSSRQQHQQQHRAGRTASQVVGRVGRTYRMPDAVLSSSAAAAAAAAPGPAAAAATGVVGSPVIGVTGVEAATATIPHNHFSSPPSSPLSSTAGAAPAAAKSTSSSSSAAAAAAGAAAAAARVPSWAQLPRDHVNQLLACNFGVMSVLGQRVLKPFLQDTIQLLPLAATMGGMMLANPPVICRVLPQVGWKAMGGWFVHFTMLVVYTLAHVLLSPLRRFTSNYYVHRWLDAFKYGSSMDYKFHSSRSSSSSSKSRRAASASSSSAAAATAAAVPAAAAAATTAAGADESKEALVSVPGTEKAESWVAAAKASGAWGTGKEKVVNKVAVVSGYPPPAAAGAAEAGKVAEAVAVQYEPAVAAAASAAATMEPKWHYHDLQQQQQGHEGAEGGGSGRDNDGGFLRLR